MIGNSIPITISMGKMKFTDPNILPELQRLGAEGWSLSGIFNVPSSPTSVGLTTKMSMPFIMAF
jgi:hypothetical protein